MFTIEDIIQMLSNGKVRPFFLIQKSTFFILVLVFGGEVWRVEENVFTCFGREVWRVERGLGDYFRN